MNFFVNYSVDLKRINRIGGGGVYGTGDEIMVYSICYSLGYLIYDLLQMLFDTSTRMKSGIVHHIIIILLFVLGEFVFFNKEFVFFLKMILFNRYNHKNWSYMSVLFTC